MSTLALIFPGIGYTFDRPLLYYSQKLALSRGMEVRRVPLSVTLNKTLPNDVRMDLACRQAAEQDWAAAQDLSGWDRVVLIAKSIGTVAAAAALQNLPVGTPAILYYPTGADLSLSGEGGGGLYRHRRPLGEARRDSGPVQGQQHPLPPL